MIDRRIAAKGVIFLLPALVATGCGKRDRAHDHATEHPRGHDHHADGHGHTGEPVVRITRWSERFELFAEHAPAVIGQEVSLLVHLTVLDTFRPLREGKVRIELLGPSSIRASAAPAEQPGIFRLAFTPQAAGTYKGRLIVEGEVTGAIDGIELTVHAGDEQARASVSSEEEGRYIEFLKEQQWNVPFSTAFVQKSSLVASIEVGGTVGTPPGGSAEVGAPVAGRIATPPGGLPRPGTPVKKGMLLARLAPAPSSPEEAARARLIVTEAEARASAARSAVGRAERLIRDEAISQRELEDARRELEVAEESVRSARRAAALFSGASAGAGAGSWQLRAPIQGTLVEVNATPGANVAPGTVLFRIVDGRELWIRARVPEQDAARLRTDRNASYQIAGVDAWLPIEIDGDAGHSLVTVGRTVDETSRTVDVIYSMREPDPRLRVGALVRVSLPAGEDFSGTVVPVSAVVDDDGRALVYVQADGEHFQERTIRTGPRAGDRTGVASGLSPGERVVVRGAHLVRLAARARSTGAHGHIH